MYIEHPYFYEGKYYANIDGEMIEITKKLRMRYEQFLQKQQGKPIYQDICYPVTKDFRKNSTKGDYL